MEKNKEKAENVEDPKGIKEIEASPKILFIATYPNKDNVNPPFLDGLYANKNYIILHPLYSYDSKVGQETRLRLPNPYPPTGKNQVDTFMRQDFYGVSQSQLLVYDLDADPGVQFITAAVLRGLPVICVSELLVSAYDYFSGAIEATIKPDGLESYLNYFFTTHEIEKVKANPETKEKIEKVLHDHLSKVEKEKKET